MTTGDGPTGEHQLRQNLTRIPATARRSARVGDGDRTANRASAGVERRLYRS